MNPLYTGIAHKIFLQSIYFVFFYFYLQEEQLIFVSTAVPVLSPLMTIYCIATRAFLFLLTEVSFLIPYITTVFTSRWSLNL